MLLGAAVEGIGIPLSELVFCWREVSFHREICLEGLRDDFISMVSDHTFPRVSSAAVAGNCIILRQLFIPGFDGFLVVFPCD